MNTVTHITGVRLTVCGRIIQRCSLCGEKLCDSKRAAMPTEPDGSFPEFPTWEVGRLVRFHAGNPRREELLPDTGKLPDDSCLALIED
jgi:hypothetical protein